MPRYLWLNYNPCTVARTFLSAASHRQFRVQLLRWFDREKRSLPWRGETDPYKILLSEVMLQQTRVAVVKERYKQFLRRFPTVFRLARAREDSVLAAWSGLGYYRRARALHRAAKCVRERGAFPATVSELMELPGIGRYTAAAVASIAFGEPSAVVDGNVKRVLDRLSGDHLSGETYWQVAQELLEPRRPGDFNQAMMELGATACVPGQPLCGQCPVIRFCASRGTHSGKGFTQQARRKAALNYLLARRDSAVMLRQRPANVSLMPGMWELPVLERRPPESKRPLLKVRHSITTTDYSISVFPNYGRKVHAGIWVNLKSANRLPLTGLTRKILGRLDLI